MTSGEAAYLGYRRFVMPDFIAPWESLSEIVRGSWEAAAQAVLALREEKRLKVTIQVSADSPDELTQAVKAAVAGG